MIYMVIIQTSQNAVSEWESVSVPSDPIKGITTPLLTPKRNGVMKGFQPFFFISANCNLSESWVNQRLHYLFWRAL